jgi:UDP-N-acetylmuramate--alanine ligase
MEGQTRTGCRHARKTTDRHDRLTLTRLGKDPSQLVSFNNPATNDAGTGDAFVIEADEYDRMFLGLTPDIAVVTNIEYDHPDCFPTEEDFYQAFIAFSQRIDERGILFACRDDAGAARLLDENAEFPTSRVSYGFSEVNNPGIPFYIGRNLDGTPQ